MDVHLIPDQEDAGSNPAGESMSTPTKEKPGIFGDYLDSDEEDIFGEHLVVESENQGLRVRVGSVFRGNEGSDNLGIWINYQEKHMESELEGPLLLSPETWRALNRLVEAALLEEEKRQGPTD